MLGTRDAMKSDISKRTVCPNGLNKTPGGDRNETITIMVITVKEAVTGTKSIRDGVR